MYTNYDEMIECIVRDDKLVDKLITEYCMGGVGNCMRLINQIPVIAEYMLDDKIRDCNRKQEALHMVVSGLKSKHLKNALYFASVVPVCKELFPSGVAKGHCKAEIEYFNEFLEMLRNPRIFSFNCKSDMEWADSYGYSRWLYLVKAFNNI